MPIGASRYNPRNYGGTLVTPNLPTHSRAQWIAMGITEKGWFKVAQDDYELGTKTWRWCFDDASDVKKLQNAVELGLIMTMQKRVAATGNNCFDLYARLVPEQPAHDPGKRRAPKPIF
jgi:uncharacterized protein (DUF2235 family)